VRKEIDQALARQHMMDWVEANRDVFTVPTAEELEFVAEIFRVPHFQQLVGPKQLARGSPVADPFVISRGHVIGGTVVTEEVLKPNAAKIPNVCAHFGVECINLETLLAREGWQY
jgi:hypothetical protein